MKIIKYQLFIAAALLAGVAIGFFAGGSSAVPPADAEAESVSRVSAEDAVAKARIQLLRRRIAELEKLLAEKDEAPEAVISNAVIEAVQNRPPAPGGPRGR